MKNLILSFVFLAFAFGQGTAQKTLSTGFLKSGVQLTPKIGNLMERAGFDLGKAGEGQPKNSSLQLDSTKTFFGYDPTGTMDSIPVFRTIYSYPQPGVRVEREYFHEDGTWIAGVRNTFFYDELDRLVEVLSQYYDPSTGEYLPDSRLEIFPRGDSPELIDSFFVYGWNVETSDYDRILSNVNIYSDDDRLEETISLFDLFGTPIEFRDVYLYDDNGDNHIIQTYAVVDDFELLTRITEKQYENHLLVEYVEFMFDGIGFSPANRTTYAYNANGALTEQVSYERDPESGEWLLTNKDTYEYDGAVRVISQVSQIREELGYAFTKVDYDYVQVAGDDLALETTYILMDMLSGWVLDSRRYYYYNTLTSVPQLPRPDIALKVAPNPTSGELQVQLLEEAVIQIFDSAGQLQRTLRFQPGDAIDLSGMPAGVYYLLAKDRAKVYHSKVVKL